MSEYLFGIDKSPVTKREAKRRDAIARRIAGNGAAYVGPASIPGNASRGWFAIPNLGEPHNSRRAAEILTANSCFHR